MEWWKSFFDAEYLRLWSELTPPSRSEQEAEGIWNLLELKRGSSLLDAPCGFGRLSWELARRGARVVGVDVSTDLLTEAERCRGEISNEQLTYVRHDLRQPLAANGFDAAINVYSSLGYGTEEDDRAILSTLRAAVRAGGRVFIETMHRDVIAALRARGAQVAQRLADGTLLIEEPQFDPVAGRIQTTWYWSGPNGSGSKSALIRVYTITELVKLLAGVGLTFRSAERCGTKNPETRVNRMGEVMTLLPPRSDSRNGLDAAASPRSRAPR